MANVILNKIKRALAKAHGISYRAKHPFNRIILPDEPKISFCTVCMGRLHHLQETLLKNIENNIDYPNVEYVILNYNSPDKLDEWAKNNLQSFISSDKIAYYKTEDCGYFHMAKAKNIVHKLAAGEIVCNVDSDNFTGKGFAYYLNEMFHVNSMRVVHGHWTLQPGSAGRLAVLKEYFMMVGGYNERLKGWGFEDDDMIARLIALGFEDIVIRDKSYLKAVKNTEEEKIQLMPPKWQKRKKSLKINAIFSDISLMCGELRSNEGYRWGKARVLKNFGTEALEI